MKKVTGHRKSSSLKDIGKMLSTTAGSTETRVRTASGTPEPVPQITESKSRTPEPGSGPRKADARKARIRLMDSSETGTVVKSAKGGYADVELDDGLTVRLHESEYVLIDEKEERLLLDGGVCRKDLKAKMSQDKSANAGENVYDLHIEAIPGGRAVAESMRLDFQMAHFHAVMRKNLPHRGKRFTLIHGVGDGILRNRIRKELDEVYVLGCTYMPGPPGVTVVIVR